MGGYDFLNFFSHYTTQANAPAWVLLVTSPFGRLGYPLGWYAWVVFSVVLMGLSARVFGNKWYTVIATACALRVAWDGQVEALVFAGVALAWLVIAKRMSVLWMGAAWLLMLIKPQVTLIVVAVFVFWQWRDTGIESVIMSACVAFVIVSITMMLWPGWTGNFITNNIPFHAPPGVNVSVFPFGLLALPLVLIPGLDRLGRLRVALAVSLLISPYLQMYHATTLLGVSGSITAAALSWLSLIDIRLILIVPLSTIGAELVRVARKSHISTMKEFAHA